jgi:hypothetical protein
MVVQKKRSRIRVLLLTGAGLLAFLLGFLLARLT